MLWVILFVSFYEKYSVFMLSFPPTIQALFAYYVVRAYFEGLKSVTRRTNWENCFALISFLCLTLLSCSPTTTIRGKAAVQFLLAAASPGGSHAAQIFVELTIRRKRHSEQLENRHQQGQSHADWRTRHHIYIGNNLPQIITQCWASKIVRIQNN